MKTARKAKRREPASAKTVLILRTCDANLKSYGGFQWPKKGLVSALDFEATYTCGGGLHGLLWGEGSGSYLNWEPSSKWLVVRVKESEVLHGQGDLTDKCKFPRGVVVYSGDRIGATDFIRDNSGAGKCIVGGTATAGDSGTATAGYRGTATAGYRGTATAGDSGTATAGYSGTATAGDSGTATAGDSGTATAGNRGTATAGYRGVIVITHYDPAISNYRRIVGVIGEAGIKANTKYKVGGDMKLVEVKAEAQS